MKHIIWREGTSGPGIDKARAWLRERFDIPGLVAKAIRNGDSVRDLPATGPFDATLRGWVRQYQAIFNASRDPAAVRFRHRVGGRLPDTGDIDWRTRLLMRIDEKLADDPAVLLPAGVVARRSPLTPIELQAAPPGERYVGHAYRIERLDLLLAALGLAARKVNTISDKRIAPLDGPLLVSEGHMLYDAATNASECAALVQALGVPNTNRWRRGPRVQDIAVLAPGTVVATLGSGAYRSDYSGESHVGIFLGKTDTALIMLDQAKGGGAKLGIRAKPFDRPHTRKPVEPLKYLNSDFSYRMPFIDQDGNQAWRRDFSIKTVMVKTDLTKDGSEYYVLLDDGSVARRDSPDDVKRTAEEQKQAVGGFVDGLFEGVDLGKDAGAKLREALEGMRPTSGAPSLAPQ